MQFALNPLHFMSCRVFIKQNNNILFISYYILYILIYSLYLYTFFKQNVYWYLSLFLISSLFAITKEYIFDFNPTNSLIICKQNCKEYVSDIFWYKRFYFYHHYEFFSEQIQNQHKFEMAQLIA